MYQRLILKSSLNCQLANWNRRSSDRYDFVESKKNYPTGSITMFSLPGLSRDLLTVYLTLLNFRGNPTCRERIERLNRIELELRLND